MRCIRTYVLGLAVALLVALIAPAAGALADEAPFSLQVAPSPLIAVVKPGETRKLELRVRNTGSQPEKLKVEMRAFTVDQAGSVQLSDQEPQGVREWVVFSAPRFTVAAGEWFTEALTFSAPQDAGFSYDFAILISRDGQQTVNAAETSIRGSVAVFTLVTIDRPGASRQFSIEQVVTKRHIYEYLPVTFDVKLKNTGNTIVQPAGNIFIQRGGTGKPITTLPLNAGGGYLLPGSGRVLTASWDSGFPAYQEQKVADNVPPKQKLTWDWAQLQNFRFGRYTAKVVAVYNDGQRDVPVVAETTFWVIPWKLLLCGVVVLIILGVGVWVVTRKVIKLSRHVSKIKRSSHHKP